MDLSISEEQALLSGSVVRFLERTYSFEHRQNSLSQPDGVSREVWTNFAELGLFALPFEVDVGGLGGEAFSFGLAMQAAGRHLVIEPLIPAICLAGGVVARAGNSDQRERWLQPLMAGEILLGLADVGAAGQSLISARRSADDWNLTGRAPLVLGGGAADVFAVCAYDPDNMLRIFMVSSAIAGIARKPVRLIDQSCAAEIDFDQVSIGSDAELRGNPLEALRRARRDAVIAASWEAVGAMSAMYEQTIEYVKQREQFGRAIASFQVVQHNLAEMAVAREEALAAVMLASLTPATDDAQASRVASGAKVKVAASADLIGKSAVQLHGGMGISDELPIASYFRKLLGFSVLHGSSAVHLDYLVSDVLARGDHLNSPILTRTNRVETAPGLA